MYETILTLGELRRLLEVTELPDDTKIMWRHNSHGGILTGVKIQGKHLAFFLGAGDAARLGFYDEVLRAAGQAIGEKLGPVVDIEALRSNDGLSVRGFGISWPTPSVLEALRPEPTAGARGVDGGEPGTYVPCPSCAGTGAFTRNGYGSCRECDGTGVLFRLDNPPVPSTPSAP